MEMGQTCPAGGETTVQGQGMKHPSSRAFFAYWDERRAGAAAPDRCDLEPGPVRALLGDIFVLSCDQSGGYPFRVAGTRLCALLGCDVKGSGFTDFFAPADRRDIEDILGIVTEEKLAAVAGVTGTNAAGGKVAMEMLLLPFSSQAHTPTSLTGLLAPFGTCSSAVGELGLTSWRYMGHPPQRFGPRMLRKLAVARGLMVYEGLV